ncbi:hypothetical protein [Marinobacterium litorale]|uniref:hypothetical protein n=1 Tax=Marinobacterium litorale TaxID=404770 RepID=UPI000481C271|nr:hypothetical protein [Marinobacterium litorale]
MSSNYQPGKGLFTREGLEDAQIIIRKGGRYRQLKLYRRGSQLFMKMGADFIALLSNGRTANFDWSWDEISGVKPVTGEMDRLHLLEEVEPPKAQKKTQRRKTAPKVVGTNA